MAGDSPVLEALDAAELLRWVRQAAVRLRAARTGLDELNVFPVPDGDTGTNLLLSIEGALASGEGDLARALLLSARGSSGVILSQLVRGWADVLTSVAQADAATLARALQRGDDLAWQAVGDPVEGTMLSVSRAAAAAALAAAERGHDLTTTVTHALEAARAALALTPEQLPVLARAGVVDAGGAGLVVVLEALDAVVRGVGTDTVDTPEESDRGWVVTRPTPLDAHGPGRESTPAFEVMYLLRRCDDSAATSLRQVLGALGDSVLVVGAADLRHVHVHTDEPGAAVEAGIAAGRPYDVRIDHLASQGHPARSRAVLAAVALVAGAGSEAMCREAGAVVVPSADAGTADVLSAVLRAGAQHRKVLVLPDGAETAAIAHQAVLGTADHGISVRVMGSRSVVQVLAGLAVLGADGGDVAEAADVEDDVAAAVAACRHGWVASAERDAMTAAGPCHADDVIGAVGDEVVLVGPDSATVACEVVDRLLVAGGELVTLVPCVDAGQCVSAVQQHLARARPDVRVVVVVGGQSRELLLVGCE